MARVLALAALPALLLHGLVLGGLPAAGADAAGVARPAPLRVRAITTQRDAPAAPDAPAVPPTDASLSETATAAAHAAIAPVVDQPPADASAVSAAAAETAPPARQPASDAVGSDEMAQPAELPAAVEEQPLLLAAAADDRHSPADRSGGRDSVDGDAIPVYPTSFAPSQTLRYHLQRGMLSGVGELTWRRDPPERADAGYDLQLQARLAGVTIFTQVSKGGFDKAGLAPVRLTDQRLRGSLRAANFQRQRGLITFSGPSVEYPLVRGVQDRLSWMIQVPAILAANPRLAAPGQRITMYVVGARGDATTWDFKFEERERIATEAGEVLTVKFSRQPRKQYDTLAEVWLDPARNFLPLRARIGNPEEGAMLELRRID